MQHSPQVPNVPNWKQTLCHTNHQSTFSSVKKVCDVKSNGQNAGDLLGKVQTRK